MNAYIKTKLNTVKRLTNKIEGHINDNDPSMVRLHVTELESVLKDITNNLPR